jgi:hypothetical protein
MPEVQIPLLTETERFIEADPSVYALKDKLCDEIPELRCLTNARFKILFNKKPKKYRGRTVLGEAKSFTKDQELYHSFQFQITLDQIVWAERPEIHEALLAHEMGHCGFDDDGYPLTVPHDLEEFHFVVRRFGLWRPEVKDFQKSLEESSGVLDT